MLEKYVELLKEHSLKITPQRLQILKYLDTHNTHPTVEEIYSELKKRSPSLSKTTVYNSLETLQKHSLIQLLTISGTQARYDFKHDMHHHFLCTNCGKIIDIDIKCPNIEKIVKEGYEIEEVHGYFKGLCKQCVQQQRGRRRES
ncbi:MAG: transcriptional repressor [Candidatus Thermoplasmatota archaeon]|nr:transcriptional repressor [Candidatus Thermoplasmatota archaeon]